MRFHSFALLCHNLLLLDCQRRVWILVSIEHGSGLKSGAAPDRPLSLSCSTNTYCSLYTCTGNQTVKVVIWFCALPLSNAKILQTRLSFCRDLPVYLSISCMYQDQSLFGWHSRSFATCPAFAVEAKRAQHLAERGGLTGSSECQCLKQASEARS